MVNFHTKQFFNRSFALALLLTVILALASVPQLFAATAQRVRFTTFNVDFNNTKSKIKSDIQAVASTTDIITMQEAKTVTVDNFLDNSWTVFQVVDNGDARRGSAIAIRNSVVSRVIDSGLVLGTRRHDFTMLDRYIAWTDVEFNNGQIMRVMALHYPPRRYDALWPEMTGNLEDFIDRTPYPVIAGGDWNFTVTNDPQHIQRDTGLKARGIGIDGFFYDDTILDFVSISEQTGLNVNSDHDPVRLIVNVQPPDAAVNEWMLY